MPMWTVINLALAILLTLGVSTVAVVVPWRLGRIPAAVTRYPRIEPTPAPRASDEDHGAERAAA